MTRPQNDGIVRVKKTRGSWVAAPLDIIIHSRLSSNSKVALIYMLCLSERENWVIKVPHVRRELNLGDSAWRAARTNLIDAGYYRLQRIHDADGRYTWSSEVSDVPEFTDSNVTIRGFSTDGFSTDGKAATKSRSTKKQQNRARAPADAGGSAAAEPVEKVKETKEFRIVQGVECWNQYDPRTVAGLVQQHGADAVASVVGALRSLGIAPLPSRVGRELQRRAAAAQASKDRVIAEARAAELEAESRRRGDLELAELMALQAKETSRERDP